MASKTVTWLFHHQHLNRLHTRTLRFPRISHQKKKQKQKNTETHQPPHLSVLPVRKQYTSRGRGGGEEGQQLCFNLKINKLQHMCMHTNTAHLKPITANFQAPISSPVQLRSPGPSLTILKSSRSLSSLSVPTAAILCCC